MQSIRTNPGSAGMAAGLHLVSLWRFQEYLRLQDKIPRRYSYRRHALANCFGAEPTVLAVMDPCAASPINLPSEPARLT